MKTEKLSKSFLQNINKPEMSEVDSVHNQKKGFKGPGCKQSGSRQQHSHNGGNKNKCSNCGSTHPPKKCPAYGKECFLRKKGYFKQYCHSTSQNHSQSHSGDGRKSRKDMYDIDQDEEVFQMQDYDSVNV